MLAGKSIAEVLGMTVRRALESFILTNVRSKLQTLSDVSLGYLTLGQRLSILSGGECQCIKLASELYKRGSIYSIYAIDEPTTGLHFSDIGRLLTNCSELARLARHSAPVSRCYLQSGYTLMLSHSVE